MEVKARYLWLTTVVIMLVAELYASILCGMIVYQSHLRPRMIVVAGIGTILASTGLLFLLTLDDPPTLYRVAFAFSDKNLWSRANQPGTLALCQDRDSPH